MLTDNSLLGETREYLTCDNEDCVKPASDLRMRCSACKMQYYCSKACQKASWKQHKVLCQHFQNQNEDNKIKIRAILDNPSVPEPGSTYGIDSCCAICLEEPTVPIKLGCKHHFCYKCLQRQQEQLILEGRYPEPKNKQLTNTKCPVCRADTLPFDILSCLRDEASIYSDRANFLRQHSKNFPNAETLIEESSTKAAAILDSALEEAKDDPFYIHLAFKRAELAEAMGEYELGESLMAESKLTFLDDGKNSYTMGDPNGRDNFYNHFRLQAHCLLNLGRPEEAKKVLQDGVKLVADDMGMFAKIDRDFYAAFTWCLYELGDYEQAIELGTGALIEMNRTYAQCHKHVALSQKALSRLDDAITTMRQALCYETPWDEANLDDARELLRELLAEKIATK